MIKKIIVIMNCLNPVSFEDEWVLSMKKELLEDNKKLETAYNFNFDKEEAKKGQFLWEIIDDDSKIITSQKV